MRRFKNILLVANDGHEATLARASTLARRNGARLTLLDVIEEWPQEVFAPSLPQSLDELELLMIEERRRRLEELLAPLRDEGIETAAKVLCGKPFLEIIRQVLRDGHDLVMATATGRGGLHEMLFGSTEMHLMRKCPCPVWVIKPSQRKPFARILAAVDLAPCDAEHESLNVKIMALATSLARLEGSELHIVHAWQCPGESLLRSPRSGVPPQEVNRLVREEKKQRAVRLDGLLQRYDLQAVPHQVHLLKGRADEVVLAIARSKRVELIVMGTVCRTGIAGFFIGNTAENTLRRVHCSALTVKPDGFETPVTLNGEASS